MVKLIRRLMAHIQGEYIVSEDLRYGRYRRRSMLKRFHNLEKAKAFAQRMVPKINAHIAVMDGVDMKTICVYKPRMRQVMV